MSTDAEFFKELMSMFKMESQEHLNSILNGIELLEKGPDSAERKSVMETVFRAAHSLKGAARTVGVVDIETIGQSLESLFALVKQKDIPLSNKVGGLIRQVVGQLQQLVVTVDEKGKVNGDKTDAMRLLEEVNDHIAAFKS